MVIIINSLLNVRRTSHVAVLHEILECLPQIGGISELICRYWFGPPIAVALPISMKVRAKHIFTIGILMRRTIEIQPQKNNDDAGAVLISCLEPIDFLWVIINSVYKY